MSAETPYLSALNTKCLLPLNEIFFLSRIELRADTWLCSGCISLHSQNLILEQPLDYRSVTAKNQSVEHSTAWSGHPWGRYIVRSICLSSIQIGTLFNRVLVFSLHLKNAIFTARTEKQRGLLRMLDQYITSVCVSVFAHMYFHLLSQKCWHRKWYVSILTLGLFWWADCGNDKQIHSTCKTLQ